MNEKIYKLSKQADDLARTIVPDLRDIPVYNRVRDEKFAELIVKECIELNKQELAFNAFERMLNRYKEHFGVEGIE